MHPLLGLCAGRASKPWLESILGVCLSRGGEATEDVDLLLGHGGGGGLGGCSGLGLLLHHSCAHHGDAAADTDAGAGEGAQADEGQGGVGVAGDCHSADEEKKTGHREYGAREEQRKPTKTSRDGLQSTTNRLTRGSAFVVKRAFFSIQAAVERLAGRLGVLQETSFRTRGCVGPG